MLKLFLLFPQFFRFWIATVASQLASRMHSLILIWLVYKWSNSTLVVGLTMVAASLPSVLISPLSGSIIDRNNKIVLMYIADFFRMTTLIVFAYLYYIGSLNIPILIIGTIVISVSSSFFNPASMAILPELVDKPNIAKANATGQISASASSIIGPLFGSAMIAQMGATNAFLAAGMLFLVSVVFLMGIKSSNNKVLKDGTSVLSDIKKGFRLIKQYEIVYKMLPKLAIINFFFSSLVVIAPVIAHGEAKNIAYLMSALGAGMLFSSLLFSSIKIDIKPNYLLAGCIVIMGGSFVGLGFFKTLYILDFFMFIIGATLSTFNIILISIYQTKLPGESLGKIMALITAISLSLQPISYGITGVFMEWISVKLVLLISGLVIFFGALGVFRIKKL